MASLNLAGKNSGYVKITAPDDSSNNPTVVLPTESGELALKSDIGSGGGGSGGGDYTPEKLVWEDKLAERELGVLYTNNNDVPLYVQLYVSTIDAAGSNAQMYIDGQYFGASGSTKTGVNDVSNPLYIIPAGSKYIVGHPEGNPPTVTQWKEARMPVAVGTGGKTVAFRGELSADQAGLTSGEWAKVELNKASIDTDNSFVDGKFKPSVAGYYQVNGSVRSNCNPVATNTISEIWKNGSVVARGVDMIVGGSGTASYMSTVNDIVYLNGTTDYIELYGFVKSTGTCAINSFSHTTFLSAVLVSGGSASGDSIWTEEDGKAVYDGDIKVNGVNVGAGSGTEAEIKNIAIGSNALPVNTTGEFNVAVGRSALRKNTEGNHNTTIGTASLYENTIGDMNTAIGRDALRTNTEGEENTAVGYKTLQYNTLGVRNTGVGVGALAKNTTGENNIGIGFQAGVELLTGSNNICIGNNTQASAPDVSNEVTIGNGSVTKTRLRGAVDVSTGSLVIGNKKENGIYQNRSGVTSPILYKEDDVLTINNPNNASDGIVLKAGNDESVAVKLKVFNSGYIQLPRYSDIATVNEKPNLYINDSGMVYKTTNTAYSAEEVDKKLAIKDKLIEKLEARLDKLEEKLKKVK